MTWPAGAGQPSDLAAKNMRRRGYYDLPAGKDSAFTLIHADGWLKTNDRLTNDMPAFVLLPVWKRTTVFTWAIRPMLEKSARPLMPTDEGGAGVKRARKPTRRWIFYGYDCDESLVSDGVIARYRHDDANCWQRAEKQEATRPAGMVF